MPNKRRWLCWRWFVTDTKACGRALQAACDAAWSEFQESLNEHYVPLRSAVRGLAALDALQSLAMVSSNQGCEHTCPADHVLRSLVVP